MTVSSDYPDKLTAANMRFDWALKQFEIERLANVVLRDRVQELEALAKRVQCDCGSNCWIEDCYKWQAKKLMIGRE